MFRPVTPRPRLPDDFPERVLSRRALRATGMRPRQITAAVRAGALLRLRRDRYLHASSHSVAVQATAAGGRVDCVSLLALLGVFVLEPPALHVQVAPDATRLPPERRGVVRHWRRTSARPDAVATPLIEALAQAVRCQPPRAAIATLDSAWHLRLIDRVGIDQVFALLPRRFRRLQPLLDRRAEAGTETLVRLMVRSLGRRFDLQVEIDGVGFADIVAEEWLIIECDSEEHHSDWRARKRDIRRDAAASRLGYVTLRFVAEDILFHPEQVLSDIRAVLDLWSPQPSGHNSGDPVRVPRVAPATRRGRVNDPEI